MAYQTGTATDADDLLAKLRSFAVAQGWTINNYVAGTNYDTVLQLSSGSCFANIVSDQRTQTTYYFGVSQSMQWKTIRMKLATTYDANLSWDAQPGTWPSTSTDEIMINHMIGPFPSYHIFGNSQYLHLVIERTAGEFDHLMIGEVDKHGTVTGGAYGLSTFWHHQSNQIDNPDSSSHALPADDKFTFNNISTAGRVLFPYDGYTWRRYGDNQTAGERTVGIIRNSGLLESLLDSSPNDFNGVTPLFPVPVIVERVGVLYSPIGTIPDIRVLNIKNLQPGDSVFLGPDEWVAFPVKAKKEPSLRDGQPNSGWYGFAYKKVL